MQIRFVKTWLLAAILPAAFLFACGNDQDQAANNEAALPHNMEQTGNTSDAENAELAAAKGKSSALIAPADLMANIKKDTANLLVVNFWKTDCLKCIEHQQALQALQTKHGEAKLHLLSVNLDEESMTNGVNLVLRKAGIVSDVFQVKANDGKWRNDIAGGWQGKLPALFIKTKDGIKQFPGTPKVEAPAGAHV